MECLPPPDLKALATLRAVVELGGVERAADAMNVGQPAVTKRLRSLDSCYGVDLMQRRGRRLALTAAGEKVYGYACLVLDRQAILMDDLASLREGHRRLRLEVTFAIGEHLLPDLLLRFNEAHPDIRIESRMGYTRRIQTRLATGLADLALLEQAPDHPDVLVEKWLDDELVLVCGPGHPLWRQGPVSLPALQDLRFVLRESNSSMRLVLDKTLAEAGVYGLPVAMEVGSTDTIIEMLGRGAHVSFLPRFAVSDALAHGSLHHIPLRELAIRRTLWLARDRASLDRPACEAFVQLLRPDREDGVDRGEIDAMV